MARKTGKTERKPQKKSEGLVAQYHAIGPASLIAALLCTSRNRITIASGRAKTA
ncbi:hypothetical protein L598_003500000060 [Mesorhizobium sp. J18]|uniref:transcriptional regulator n=1 Tax=Mesorhizobium sp. J18 TaxID=935263 RepID=UPI00119B5BF9|nr:transcriptional regulator [Mesorhizobium sp. J18]TWG94665.1 hypothetical protein L598_003500000060 [Mesorhizobium sp. J18]